MGVISWLKNQWKKSAVHYTFVPIPPERQDDPVNPVKLESEKHYFRLWLSEMFLKDDKRVFRTFVPVVHSSVSLGFGDKVAQELPYVAGPVSLGLDSTLGKGVQLDHPLTNLLPFRGGTIGVTAALVAYKERDFLKGFLEVLEDVSGLLNVGQLSSQLKVVDGVVDGIQNLLGAGNKDIHLLYFQGFAGDSGDGGADLEAGYTAVIKVKAGTLDESQLFVKERQLHFGPDLESSQPLEGYDYILLRREVTTTRDDFLSFERLDELLRNAIRKGVEDPDAGDAIIRTALVVVWDIPDLTNSDRIRVAKALKRAYEEAIGAGEEPVADALNLHVLAVHEDSLEESAKWSGRLPLAEFLSVVER